MESPLPGHTPVPLPVDGKSPCQIFADRMEDIGLQVESLLLTLSEIDGLYRACLARQSASPQLMEQRRRFENVQRIAAAMKTAVAKTSEI